jgi:hypothetical protein
MVIAGVSAAVPLLPVASALVIVVVLAAHIFAFPLYEYH